MAIRVHMLQTPSGGTGGDTAPQPGSCRVYPLCVATHTSGPIHAVSQHHTVVEQC